jgi:TatD DNase family protein
MGNQTKDSLSPSPVTSYSPPVLIDTHCHLEMDAFDNDRDAVLQRARNAGIEAIVTVGSDCESIEKGIKLSQDYDFIYTSCGLHPHDARNFSESIHHKFKEYVKNEKVVAIGETGLDYHYDNSPRSDQREVFLKHIVLSQETGLPLIIHSREAEDDTIRILRDADVSRGVFHCFSGGVDMAEKVMALGFYISLAGPVTFKKASLLKEVARLIPDDYLLIETDAPYLAPLPHRGKRNEPSYLQHTVKHIAELRNVTYEDVARITTLNAKRAFGIGVISEKGVIAYKIRDSLYLNITNRCTNKCSFCVKFHTDYVKGHMLRLDHEPSEDEIKKAIGNPAEYGEVVFCGYGEPLQRLDVVKHIAQWIKKKGGTVRVNTNGHANLIHKKNIVPELKGLVDRISVSMDAHDEATYNRMCRPLYENAFRAVIDFIRLAKEIIPEVQITVVNLEEVNIAQCKRIAEQLGVAFRIRSFNVVG